jgi:hypothetical protein
MDRLMLFILILASIMMYSCSSKNKFNLIDFRTYINKPNELVNIEGSNFLYLDTTLYTQLSSTGLDKNIVELSKYNIHKDDTFILKFEEEYQGVENFLSNPPKEFYDFFDITFGLKRDTLKIKPTVLIHNGKAFIEIYKTGMYIGVMIKLMDNNEVSIGIAYVLTS